MGVVRREMSKGYWDGMCGVYEDEIHSVLHNDHKGLIRRRISKIASKEAVVADVGCGIGHFLPLLSSCFGKVYANDISTKLLNRARAFCGDRTNIHFLDGDIRKAFRKLPRVDCVVSVNSLIASSFAIRQMMLGAMVSILKPGGHLVLVVPSLESSRLVDVRLVQWMIRNKASLSAALGAAYPKDAVIDHQTRQGIFRIDGVATKHFFQEELRVLLAERALDVLEIVKIEYAWNTEFESPPRWMREPYPWDWLIVARRKK